MTDAVAQRHDAVDHPPHYTAHPSGVEFIEIGQHFNFCRGSAIKYIWRAGLKGSAIEDLKKARRYLDYEIARLEMLGSREAAEAAFEQGMRDEAAGMDARKAAGAGSIPVGVAAAIANAPEQAIKKVECPEWRGDFRLAYDPRR